MSLKRNILVNYVSRAYVMLVGFAAVPFYIEFMGAEAYGLVGFFAIVQVSFNLLDLGLTPTIAREVSRYHAGAISQLDFLRLFKALNALFLGVAVLGGITLFGLAGFASTNWLNLNSLSPEQVTSAMKIMAACVAIRWVTGLYRGVVSGSEKLVWLGGYDIFISSMRFLGVFITMSVWGYTPNIFFWHQLAVAVLEFLLLLAKCRKLLPDLHSIGEPIGWTFKPVRSLLRFSLSMSFIAIVWVLISQSDKLILSGILPLADYGYFTLAVVVASGILMVSDPLVTATLPRMSRLYAEGAYEEIYQLYRDATQVISVVAGGLSAALALAPDAFLYAWTGSAVLVDAAAPILSLYAIGNGMLALAAFPYYLQYVKGKLKYHLIGTGLMATIFIPVIIIVGMRSGGLGVAWVWVSMNAAYLFLWSVYVHSKVAPNLSFRWLLNDVLGVLLPIYFAAVLLSLILPEVQGRLSAIIHFCIMVAACFMMGVLASPLLRTFLFQHARSVLR